MGFKSFLKGGSKPLLGQEAADLELSKHFRLVKKLGKGSYATVYEAERLTDGQRYALKLTELKMLPQEDKVAVVEEIRLLASLQHPNIITYYEAFVDHDKLCVVTELVGGGDLGSYLAKLAGDEDFLWERQVWGYFLQAALGVQYLHHNHVLHRDLKPQNIMCSEKHGKGLLKIVDLGVSAELARVFTNVQIGTPHYMAPEMWLRQAYSYSADIFALGCILHELCTLRPTFLSEAERTEADIMRRVLEGRIAPIPTRYSQDLRNLVDRMLQRDPAMRPTIDEILSMPQVKSKFVYLPLELQRLAEEQERRPEALKLQQGVGQLPADIHDINRLLPPSRYPTGQGVAELMCGPIKRRSFSLPDLHAAEERQALAGGGGDAAARRALSPPARLESQARSQSERLPSDIGSSADGGDDAFADGSRPGGRGGGGMHTSSSLTRLDDEEVEQRVRRRSIMVGDLLFRLQQEQERKEEGAAGAAAGVAPPNGAPAHARLARMSHDAADLAPASMRAERPAPLRASPPGTRTGQALAVANPSVPEGEEQDLSYHGGHACSPAPAGGGGGAVAEAGGGGRSSGGGGSVLRRSVAVAEVLYRHEATQGARHQDLDAPLPSSPLKGVPRAPFEFIPGSGGPKRAANGDSKGAPAGGSPAAGAAAAMPAAPRSALLAQLASQAAAGRGGAAPPAAAAQPAAAAVPQPPVPEKKEEKKKKKGRLWRLMYGEETSGMHQPLW